MLYRLWHPWVAGLRDFLGLSGFAGFSDFGVPLLSKPYLEGHTLPKCIVPIFGDRICYMGSSLN